MVGALLGLPEPPRVRPRRRRARGRDLPREPRRDRARSIARRRGAALGGAPALQPGGRGRMIASVRGEVLVRRPDHVVVEAGGVGYRLAVSAETLRAVPGRGTRGDPARPPRRARRLAVALRLRERGGARPLPAADLGLGRRARRSRSRCSPAARRASCCARSRPGTRSASRPCPGSASEPPSGSSSSCKREGRRGARRGGARRRRGDDAEPRSAGARGPAQPRLHARRGRAAARRRRGRQRRGADRRRAAQRRRGRHEREGGMSADPELRGLEPGHATRRSIAARIGGRAPPPSRDEELDRSLRPAPPRRVRQPGAGHRPARDLHRGRAQRRGEPLDHVLLAGPPGLGKTSLAHIVAAELEAPLVQTAGPALERKADIAAFLTALEPGSVFFIDEIHRLNRAIEETLYPAMEERRLPGRPRPGRRRAHGDARPAAVHADRRDHPRPAC